MPFMDGYQSTQLIRKLLRILKVKSEPPQIIAVTGHVEIEYQVRAIQSGMDSVLSKPVTSEQLGMLLMANMFQFSVSKELQKIVEAANSRNGGYNKL